MVTPAEQDDAEESDPLKDLGHLTDAYAHHVINAFAAIVSNAELIRARASAPIDRATLESLASSMIEAAVDASQVGRRMIEWTKSITAVESEQTGRSTPTVDLNRLI